MHMELVGPNWSFAEGDSTHRCHCSIFAPPPALRGTAFRDAVVAIGLQDAVLSEAQWRRGRFSGDADHDVVVHPPQQDLALEADEAALLGTFQSADEGLVKVLSLFVVE